MQGSTCSYTCAWQETVGEHPLVANGLQCALGGSIGSYQCEVREEGSVGRGFAVAPSADAWHGALLANLDFGFEAHLEILTYERRRFRTPRSPSSQNGMHTQPGRAREDMEFGRLTIAGSCHSQPEEGPRLYLHCQHQYEIITTTRSHTPETHTNIFAKGLTRRLRSSALSTSPSVMVTSVVS